MCKQLQILGRELWTVPLTLWGSAKQDSLEHVCLKHMWIWWVCFYSSQCSQGRRASCSSTRTGLPAGHRQDTGHCCLQDTGGLRTQKAGLEESNSQRRGWWEKKTSKQQQCAQAPRQFRVSREVFPFTPFPHIKNKDKNKPRREGRKNLTKFDVCFRPIATTASLNFHLPLWCYLASTVKSTVFYTQTAKGSALCWEQKLETGVDCKMDSNCCAQGSHNTKVPKATLQRAARLSPQAVTGPAREKVSSGDGYGSHTL